MKSILSIPIHTELMIASHRLASFHRELKTEWTGDQSMSDTFHAPVVCDVHASEWTRYANIFASLVGTIWWPLLRHDMHLNNLHIHINRRPKHNLNLNRSSIIIFLTVKTKKAMVQFLIKIYIVRVHDTTERAREIDRLIDDAITLAHLLCIRTTYIFMRFIFNRWIKILYTHRLVKYCAYIVVISIFDIIAYSLKVLAMHIGVLCTSQRWARNAFSVDAWTIAHKDNGIYGIANRNSVADISHQQHHRVNASASSISLNAFMYVCVKIGISE